MLENGLFISNSYLKQLNSKVTETNFLKESFGEKKLKLNNTYKKQLNKLYIDHIEYKSILANNFTINAQNIRNMQTMIYESRILKEEEEKCFEMIRFFRNKPIKLVELIHKKNKENENKIDQAFIDFVVVSLFPTYLNSMCACRQPHNLFIFMKSAIEIELSTVEEFSQILPRGRITNQLFGALLKKIDTQKFVEKLLRKLNSSLSKLGEGEETSHTSNRERRKSHSTQGSKSHSSKYRNILDTFKYSRNPGARRISSTEFQESPMNLTNQNTSLFIFEEESFAIDDKTVDKKALEDALEAMIICIDEHLPLGIKLFFYLLQSVCKKGNLLFRDVIKLFWFNRFLILSVNTKNKQNWLDTREKIIKEKLAKLLRILLAYCQQKVEGEDSPHDRLERALTRVPDKLVKKLLKEPTLKITLEKKRSSNLRDGFSIPNSDHNVISNISNTEIQFTENQFKTCSFHNEALIANIQELTNLIDLFGRANKQNADLMQTMVKFLNSPTVKTFTKNPFECEDIFIIFIKDMKDVDPIESVGEKGPLEELLKLGFLTDELVDYFDGASLKEILKYYKNFHLSGESAKNKTSLLPFYHNPNLRKIRVREMEENFFIEEKDRTEEEGNDIEEEANETESVNEIESTSEVEEEEDNVVEEETNETEEERGEREKARQKIEKAKMITNSVITEINSINEKYDNLSKEISDKLSQLSYKQLELSLLSEEYDKYKNFRIRVFEENILHRIDKLFSQPSLDLCLEGYSKCSKREKNMLNGFSIRESFRCGSTIPLDPKMNTMKDSFPRHFHLRCLNELLNYLNQQDLILHYVEDQKPSNSLKNLIGVLRDHFSEQLPKFIESPLLKEYKRLTNSDTAIDSLFEEYFTKLLNTSLFPKDLTSQNEGFRLTCNILEFCNLGDFFKTDNADSIGKALGPAIKALSRMERAQSFKQKLRAVKDCMQKIVGVMKTSNGKIPGNEEVHPIFVYCVLKAKPRGWLSANKFLQLVIPQREAKGEAGFLLAQLEVATKIIETIDRKNIIRYNFEKHILENEILHGVHFIRQREEKLEVCKDIEDIELLHI